MSYSRPVTGNIGGGGGGGSSGLAINNNNNNNKLNNNSIARLSALRKSFLSPVSEASAISYLTPAEAAYLRQTSIKSQRQRSTGTSLSMGSTGSGSESLSTSLMSNKSSSNSNSKPTSSRSISAATTTGSESIGYDIASSMTSSPSRSPPLLSRYHKKQQHQQQQHQQQQQQHQQQTKSQTKPVELSIGNCISKQLSVPFSSSSSNSNNSSTIAATRNTSTVAMPAARIASSNNNNSISCKCISNNSSINNSSNSNNKKSLQQQQQTPFISKIEASILRSSDRPISITETSEITAAGARGIFANKCEVCEWKGDLPLCAYPINEDACPEVINKRLKQKLEYVQEMAVRYLKPPTPPTPGDIIIKHEPNKPTAPAPPLIIRQQPPRPCTPEPLVIREAPPPPPPCIGRKVITICGKKLPAPPRKVVIERMPPIPSKPQSVVIERWLPYSEQKRRVIYQKAPPDPVVCKPKNIIVQWDAPEVSVKKDVRHLGIIRANPCEYVQRYASSLKQPVDLPQFVKDIQPESGIELAANKRFNPVPELFGDVCALKMVNLDCEGLSMYREQVKDKCNRKACNLCPIKTPPIVVSATPPPPPPTIKQINIKYKTNNSNNDSCKISPRYVRYSNGIKFGGISTTPSNSSPKRINSTSSSSSSSSSSASSNSSRSNSCEIDRNNVSYGSSFSSNSNSSSGCGDCEARFSYTISTTDDIVSPAISPVVNVCSPAKFM